MAAINKTLKDSHNFMDDGENLDDGMIVLVVALAYYIIVLLLGLPGNAIIIQALGWKKRKTSTDVFIIAQAIVDFLACVFSPALTTLFMCRVALPVASIEDATASISLFLTTMLSVDRYLVICRPLRRRMPVRRATLLVMTSVAIILSIYAAKAILTDVYSIVMNGHRRCIFMIPYTMYYGFVVSCGILYIFSFLTSTLLYALIYAFLRKRAKIHADLVGNGLATINTNNNSGGLSEAKAGTRLGKQSGLQPAVSNPLGMKMKSDTVQESLPSEMAGCSGNAHDPRLPYERRKFRLHLGSSEGEQTSENRNSLRPTQGLTKSMPKSQKTSLFQHRSTNHPTIRKNKKIDNFGRKTTSMLFIITVYFFVTWSPTVVLFCFLPQMLGRNTGIPGFPLVHNILRAFRLTNHFVNFFVYYSVSNSFRKDVKESYRKCFDRK